MRVLQFAFDGNGDNRHLPDNYGHNTVVYTGTHDNPTTRFWFEALPEPQRQTVSDYLKRPVGGTAEAAPALIELAWNSAAALAMAPLQDLLNLGEEARMNRPRCPEGNWRWRCTEAMLNPAVWQWLKEELAARLRAAGHDIVDFGAGALDPDDDYPDFIVPLARAVAAGQVERGVAICGSGVGACVCANKIAGVRAALIEDHFSARQGVEDDHLNVLCLGGRTEGPAVAWDLVETFLAASYSQAERHLRRLAKVAALEAARRPHDPWPGDPPAG